ncbi:MAG: 5-formyltetrahydrofolate cyclo-ligase [Christensenellaceae bacterium]|nr:5-formyltetrahydrofolate cyclo-ligase [Christensenellaceae bacterium]
MGNKQEKEHLRKNARLILVANNEEKSDTIRQFIMKMPQYLSAKVVYLFMSLPNEPSTKELIAEILGEKIVAIPIVDGKEIKFARLYPNMRLVSRKFNIMEPENIEIMHQEADIIFIPMVAFDKNFGRLGHGYGYYDKYLKTLKRGVKVGLAFSDYEVENVFSTDNDITMDIIVTDEGIFERKG